MRMDQEEEGRLGRLVQTWELRWKFRESRAKSRRVQQGVVENPAHAYLSETPSWRFTSLRLSLRGKQMPQSLAGDDWWDVVEMAAPSHQQGCSPGFEVDQNRWGPQVLALVFPDAPGARSLRRKPHFERSRSLIIMNIDLARQHQSNPSKKLAWFNSIRLTTNDKTQLLLRTRAYHSVRDLKGGKSTDTHSRNWPPHETRDKDIITAEHQENHSWLTTHYRSDGHHQHQLTPASYLAFSSLKTHS